MSKQNTIMPAPTGSIADIKAISIESLETLQLERTKEGAVRSTFHNYCEIIENDGYLHGKIKYNALAGRAAIEGAFWDIESHYLRDNDVDNIRNLISEIYLIDDEKKVRSAIRKVAQDHSFHPVRDMLTSLRWDGQKRIGELFPVYLGAERSSYTEAATLIMLHGAIQRVFNPGCKFDLVIVLSDQMQGTGKSTICRFLAIRDEWFSDALQSFDKPKDTFEIVRGHWILELGEMLTTKNTKTIEGIKSYISRTTDSYRTPYGVFSEDIPRQSIFIGTSNKMQFLPEDRTGNRRFLPIICDGSKAEKHPLDNERETRDFIIQCYAEAIAIGTESGWKLTIDKVMAEQVAEIRAASTPEDTRVGMIQAWLDDCDEDIVCSRMIYDKVFEGAFTKSNQKGFVYQDIAEIMNTQIKGWERYKGKHGRSNDNKYRFDKPYGKQRAWQRVRQPVPEGVPSKAESISEEGFMSVLDTDSVPF